MRMICIDLTDDVIDLTDRDVIMDEADAATEKVVGQEKVRFVPFLDEVEVPDDFIPICPTPTQSTSCNKVIMEKRKSLKLDNLTILKAFSTFDCPDLFGKKNVGEWSDLETQIFNSGKIYFLCKLFQILSNHEALTDIQIIVLTLEESVEKILFDIFRNYCGHNCVRLSRLATYEVYGHDKQKEGVNGIALSIAAKFTPIKIQSAEFIINFDAAITPPQTRAILTQMTKFVEEPSILYLSNIGTSELRLKEFLSRTNAYNKQDLENMVLHATGEMFSLVIDKTTQYTPLQCLVWNDVMAEQLVEWIFYGTTEQFYFKYPAISVQDPLLVEEVDGY